MPDFKIKLSLDNSQAKQEVHEVNDEVRKLQAAAKGMGDEIDEGMGKASSSSVAFGHASAASFAIAQKGADAILGIINSIPDAYSRAIEAHRRYAQESMSKDDQLRELASMQGRRVDDKFLGEFDKFQRGTGLRFEEALALQKGAGESGAQYVGSNLTEDQFAKFQVEMGRAAVAKGLDAGQMGKLAGIVAGMSDVKGMGTEAGVKALLGEAWNSMLTVQAGSGDTSALIGQLQKAAGTQASKDKNFGEFMKPSDVALGLTVAAQVNPSESEVILRNMIEGSRRFEDKKAGPFLKAAGVEPGMDLATRLAKIDEGLRAELAKAPEGTKITDIAKGIWSSGQEADALALGVAQFREVKANRERVLKDQGGVDNLMRDIQGAEGTRVGQARTVEASKATFENALGRTFGDQMNLEKLTTAEMVARKELDSVEANGWDSAYDWSLGLIDKFDGIPDGRTLRIHERMREAIEGTAKERGVTLPGFEPGVPFPVDPGGSPLKRAAGNAMRFNEAMGQSFEAFRQAGIDNPMAAIIERQTKILEGIAESNKQIAESTKAAAEKAPARPKTMTNATPGGGRAQVGR